MGADHAIVGKDVLLNGQKYTVIDLAIIVRLSGLMPFLPLPDALSASLQEQRGTPADGRSRPPPPAVG